MDVARRTPEISPCTSSRRAERLRASVSAPLDGRYALVQATWYAPDAGASYVSPVVTALRAEGVVQGALWIIGSRAVDGSSIGPLETTTLSIVADTATNVCSVSAGSVGSSLFPATGATTRAAASWDGGASTLTMVLVTPKGANVELVFLRE